MFLATCATIILVNHPAQGPAAWTVKHKTLLSCSRLVCNFRFGILFPLPTRVRSQVNFSCLIVDHVHLIDTSTPLKLGRRLRSTLTVLNVAFIHQRFHSPAWIFLILLDRV